MTEHFAQHPDPALTLVLGCGLRSIVEGDNGATLRQSILLDFLPRQRWFAGKGQHILSISLVDAAEYTSAGSDFLIACVDATIGDGIVQRYLLPLTIAWETKSYDPLTQPYMLARARFGMRIGALHDAMASPSFAQAVVRGICAGIDIPTQSGGRVAFQPANALAEISSVDEPIIERLGQEQSNTSVRVGENMILKVLRRLQPGVYPEVEISRFLTDVAGFKNTPAFLGSAEIVDARGEPTAIAVLQGFIQNQGDGWSFTLDYLNRVLGHLEIMPTSVEVNVDNLHGVFRALSQTLGTRIGELHQAFALPVDDPAFRPEPVAETDVVAWKSLVRAQAAQAQAALRRAIHTCPLSLETRFDIETLLERWTEVESRIEAALPTVSSIKKTRLHGDLHLGQVVVVRDDFYILDFEGEPLRSLEERRTKHSPLRDVAGMVRSFSYAARIALQQRGGHRPELREQLVQAITEWEQQTIKSFLENYRAAAARCPSIPADDATFQQLLDLFLLEKALYEIYYEATNRPDWIAIPVYGVLCLLSSNRVW